VSAVELYVAVDPVL